MGREATKAFSNNKRVHCNRNVEINRQSVLKIIGRCGIQLVI